MTIQPTVVGKCLPYIYMCVCVLFFHLSIVLYFEKNASVDNQCFGFQLLLTNHPKHSGLKCLFVPVYSSVWWGSASCWCRLLVSLLLVGRLAETLGGWAPLCTRGPRVSFSTCLSMWPRQQGRWASSVAAQISQECKAVVARPSYDLTTELSSITSTVLCWLEQVTGPTQIQEEGTPPGHEVEV